MAGDEHAAVAHLEKPSRQVKLDGLAGEVGADVVAEALEAEAAAGAHLARAGAQPGSFGRSSSGRHDDRLEPLAGQLEALGRREHADALMGTLSVVVGDPGIELSLGLLTEAKTRPARNSARSVLWKRSTLPVVVGLRGAVSRWRMPRSRQKAVEEHLAGATPEARR